MYDSFSVRCVLILFGHFLYNTYGYLLCIQIHLSSLMRMFLSSFLSLPSSVSLFLFLVDWLTSSRRKGWHSKRREDTEINPVDKTI